MKNKKSSQSHFNLIPSIHRPAIITFNVTFLMDNNIVFDYDAVSVMAGDFLGCDTHA